MSAMGTNLSGDGRMNADDRYELAALAQNQQRLNYPKHIIMLGLLLVFVSIVTLAIAWQMRSGAQDKYAKRTYELTQIEQLVNQIATLQESQANSSGQDRFQPIPDILSKFKRFGEQANLEHDIGLPKNPKVRPEGNAKLMTYPYNLRDSSLEHMLNWIKISTEQIPGLSVTDLEIKPAKQDWTIRVTLSRYERKE